MSRDQEVRVTTLTSQDVDLDVLIRIGKCSGAGRVSKMWAIGGGTGGPGGHRSPNLTVGDPPQPYGWGAPIALAPSPKVGTQLAKNAILHVIHQK